MNKNEIRWTSGNLQMWYHICKGGAWSFLGSEIKACPDCKRTQNKEK